MTEHVVHEAARIRTHVTCTQCWRQWVYDLPDGVHTNLALLLANEGWWPERQTCPKCMASKAGR